jgi:nucleoside-diphosphate-sugar epimerase
VTRQSVILIGGTGFLGYHAIQEFLQAGYRITAVGLPPGPPAGLFPPEVDLVIENVDQLPDEELARLFAGHHALVFAAGMDDRVPHRRPIYPLLHRANVENMTRILTAARKAGVKRAVVLGSYFVHLHRIRPQMNLAGRHPYIRSRLEQEKAAFSIPGLEAMVLELPYIFGSMPIHEWKPLWKPLVDYIHSSRTIFYMKGGSACTSAVTVGRAIRAAVERGQAGTCYPIGQENLTWEHMLHRLARAAGREIRVVTLPTWLIAVATGFLWLSNLLRGIESGLALQHFAPLQTAEIFLDAEASRRALGYEPGDLEDAFRRTVRACQDAAK